MKRLPFSGKIIVNIGKPIPYSNDVDSVVEKWTEEIQKLTGFTYIKDENKAENSEIQQN